jgi:DNA (cytosine-5)-methyltransferase 1
MKTRRLLDLYCCAGGAARGYQLAGFHVTGIDIAPQPRYAGDVFIQADALAYVREHGREYDAIHASPPCQQYTQAQRIQNRQHQKLIEPTRELLALSGKPWVIENVPGAPLRVDLILCGSMFGLHYRNLTLYRHRWFEFGNFAYSIFAPASCAHHNTAISIFGHTVLGAPKNGVSYRHPNEREHLSVAVGRAVMGCEWMTRDELSEAIPPAYTTFIGAQLMQALEQL